MVRFMCDECRQEAAWVCLVGLQEQFLCRMCEANGSRASRRLGMLGGKSQEELLCSVCKGSAARVFCPSDGKVYCWNCQDGESAPGPKFMVLGNAVCMLGENVSSGTVPAASQSSDGPEGFAGWPSDSEDSLLIHFTPSWTGASEFLDTNWLQGTGLMRSESDVDQLKQDDWKLSKQGCFGCEVTHEKPDGMPQETRGAPVRSQGSEGIFLGMDGVPVIDPHLPILSAKEANSCQSNVVPGVPYGMVPVTAPPALVRRCPGDRLIPRDSIKQDKAMAQHQPSQLCANMDRSRGAENSPTGVLQSSCEDEDDARDDGTGSGMSGSLGPPQRRCTHCGASKTPQWRAGPFGQKTLCNACGVKYKAGRLSSCSGPGSRARKMSQMPRKMIVSTQGRSS